MGDLTWDDDIAADEDVSESEIKEAEAMGKVAIGKYLCRCAGSEPRQKDFSNYSCIAANLKWEIEKALEINGVAVQGDEGDVYVGRSIFDDVALYSASEKDGMRKRRILVAKRVGLIGGSDDTITKAMWKTGIIDKRAIINYIEEEYMPKGGTVMKRSRKVAFDGYESADGMTVSDQTPDIDAI